MGHAERLLGEKLLHLVWSTLRFTHLDKEIPIQCSEYSDFSFFSTTLLLGDLDFTIPAPLVNGKYLTLQQHGEALSLLFNSGNGGRTPEESCGRVLISGFSVSLEPPHRPTWIPLLPSDLKKWFAEWLCHTLSVPGTLESEADTVMWCFQWEDQEGFEYFVTPLLGNVDFIA